MISLIQRVTHANVIVDDKIIAQIAEGILALIGIEKADQIPIAEKLLDKILNFRIFADQNGKMNLNLTDIKGGLLLVPQFTLAADTKQGTRPGFSTAMPPQASEQLFNHLVTYAKANYAHIAIAIGQFGAHMRINLCNDGPATFMLACN
jgi:D-aminoacyl-tRNA deacylase